MAYKGQGKLEHGYHDAYVRTAEFLDDRTIMLGIDLCGSCSDYHGGGRVHLYFYDVRNYDEVKARIEDAMQSPNFLESPRPYIDFIDGITYETGVGYSVGHVTIQTSRVSET